MDEYSYALGSEFKNNPLFGIIFHIIYEDLEKIFSQNVGLNDIMNTYALPPFTKPAIQLIRESHIRNCTIMEAAEGIGMMLSDLTDWTIAYAADVYITLNNPVIYL